MTNGPLQAVGTLLIANILLLAKFQPIPGKNKIKTCPMAYRMCALLAYLCWQHTTQACRQRGNWGTGKAVAVTRKIFVLHGSQQCVLIRMGSEAHVFPLSDRSWQGFFFSISLFRVALIAREYVHRSKKNRKLVCFPNCLHCANKHKLDRILSQVTNQFAHKNGLFYITQIR